MGVKRYVDFALQLSDNNLLTLFSFNLENGKFQQESSLQKNPNASKHEKAKNKISSDPNFVVKQFEIDYSGP